VDYDDACIETLECETDGGLGQRARIGLIVLQSDQTIEHQFARIFRADDIALYHARIPNAWEVSEGGNYEVVVEGRNIPAQLSLRAFSQP